MLIFDAETNGLYDYVTEMHCLHIYDTQQKKLERYNSQDGNLRDSLIRLHKSKVICGHGIINFDIPMLKKLYPRWNTSATVVDTLTISRVIYTNIKDYDGYLMKHRKVPEGFKKYYGRHSLAAWGMRLGVLKGDFGETTDWADWSQEMDDYCVQDIEVTQALLAHLMELSYSKEALKLEHQVAIIIQRQVQFGFKFDEANALLLREQLETESKPLIKLLREMVPAWYMPGKEFTPKRDNKSQGYIAGATLTKVKLNEFNPGSGPQIINRLKALYGWEPTLFTVNESPKIDTDTLRGLSYPPCKNLIEYGTLKKCLGYVSTGEKAWLKKVRNGRIHGKVNTNGAVTGRFTHSDPNLGQIPSAKKIEIDPHQWGKKCRALFTVTLGYILFGVDAKGIELRCLGHYMAAYDGGAYAKAVVHGSKKLGTDAHTLNMKAAGLSTRDGSKTFIYALLYGSGIYLLGLIFLEDMSEDAQHDFNERYPDGDHREDAIKQLGSTAKNNLMAGLPALEQLTKAVQLAAKRGYIIGLDGRKIHIRENYRALNSLLQSASAVIMKKALVIFDTMLIDKGLKHSQMSDTPDYEFVANVHDEFQVEILPKHQQLIKECSELAMIQAGEAYNFKCIIEGDSNVGANWSETH